MKFAIGNPNLDNSQKETTPISVDISAGGGQ